MYIDFHSHILPQADHGSESLEMSLSQLKYAKKADVSVIVATPHFYLNEDTIESFLARREKAFEELEKHNDSGIRIIKASEVQIQPGLAELPDLPKLCVGDSNYIFLEFPPEPWPCHVLDTVREIIRERRLRPIFAHIDRYSHMSRECMLNLNVDIQLNPGALLDSRKRRNYYLDLIAEDSVHILGSDCHGDGMLAYKDFTAAIKKLGKLMPYMTENASRIISSGERK